MIIDENNFTFIIESKGKTHIVLLDESDFHYFKQWNWSMSAGYVCRRNLTKDCPKRSRVALHRYIVMRREVIPTHLVVDHINRNTLDNRNCNLRVTTYSVNASNVSDEGNANRKQQALKASWKAAILPRTEKQESTSRNNIKNLLKSGKHIHRGSDNVRSKKLIDIDTGKIYESVRRAALEFGINYSTLRSRLQGYATNNTSLRYLNKEDE